MAKNNQEKQYTSSVSSTECANATLMQWGDDPIIADCKAHGCREVASQKRTCIDYEPSAHLPKPMKHLPKYAGLQGLKQK